jgi:hypothetical protein
MRSEVARCVRASASSKFGERNYVADSGWLAACVGCGRDSDESICLCEGEDRMCVELEEDPPGEFVVHRDHLEGAAVLVGHPAEEAVYVMDTLLVEAFVSGVGG